MQDNKVNEVLELEGVMAEIKKACDKGLETQSDITVTLAVTLVALKFVHKLYGSEDGRLILDQTITKSFDLFDTVQKKAQNDA